MQYLGGKSRQAKHIAAILQAARDPGDRYTEPFMGGASVLVRMDGERYASDSHEALITMWWAVQSGWRPPHELSEADWRVLKDANDPADPMTAFAGFGCSFGGGWFKGYGRGSRVGGCPGKSHRSIARKAPALDGARITHADYRSTEPVGVIYCDPPYAGTTQYKGVEPFDGAEFWRYMRAWVDAGAKVFVSEYSAPDDWVCVWSQRAGGSQLAKSHHVDRLWAHESQGF